MPTATTREAARRVKPLERKIAQAPEETPRERFLKKVLRAQLKAAHRSRRWAKELDKPINMRIRGNRATAA